MKKKASRKSKAQRGAICLEDINMYIPMFGAQFRVRNLKKMFFSVHTAFMI